MALVSYAQHGEDVLLDSLYPEVTAGFYVDIGANDPSFCSVTRYFYERGWSGINVEPVPSLCEKLRKARPRDLTLNLGLSDREGSLTFYESPSITGWSTFSPNMAAHYRKQGMSLTEQVIPVLTLTGLFEKYVDRPVDFLKIDVEGLEAEVVRGIDWSQCRPRALVIENAWHEAWSHLIPDADYQSIFLDQFNRYYVRRDEPRFAAVISGKLPPARHFVRHRDGRRFERKLAGLAHRENLGPIAGAIRRALFRSLHLATNLRRGWRRAG